MHGFPDSLHLYGRLVPHLADRVPLVRFDFLRWGRSDKPSGYPYTATNQAGDLAAVVDAAGGRMDTHRVVLVAHDASGRPPSTGRWPIPAGSAGWYRSTPITTGRRAFRRPPAIALCSTPVVRAMARASARHWPRMDRRLYRWQVGKFVFAPTIRGPLPDEFSLRYVPAQPAFWRMNDDLLGAVVTRRRRIGDMRRFQPLVRVVFGPRPLAQPQGGPPIRLPVPAQLPAQRTAPAAERWPLRTG